MCARMKTMLSVVALSFVFSPLSVQASCFDPTVKMRFAPLVGPVTSQQVFASTAQGAAAGIAIGGAVGGITSVIDENQTRLLAPIALVGSVIGGVQGYRSLARIRKAQQLELSQATFYYLSHPDFADEQTTDEEREHAISLVQGFIDDILVEYFPKLPRIERTRFFEKVIRSAEKLDLEEKGCKTKENGSFKISRNKLMRLIARELLPSYQFPEDPSEE